MLGAFLDFDRAVVLRKVRNLTDADAADRLVPSATTLAGLVRHLAVVERSWFQVLLAPAPGDRFPTAEQDTAGELRPDRGETLAGLIHIIEETARHAGHADILRELTDGETGAL
ncbi:DUF664 domain-containing protein [Micromonospora sp. KC723]|uniref:mycothiol transferase n=1 Tax=Micromonospora sp. KC723 TaxID=2530381 RepID=UPI001FB59A61|nr:DUF664 domain-containing protein [Micromonospora sp. KC723]